MSIIEKEINRREDLISDNGEKIERIAMLRTEADTLEAEVANFDEKTLREEIAELKSYLAPAELESETIVADPRPLEPDTLFGTTLV